MMCSGAKRTGRGVLIVVATLIGLSSCETVSGALAGMSGSRPLDEKTIIAGLKEALEVGTRNAVKEAGSRDGFLGNAVIRIPLPLELEQVDRRLRQLGFGGKMDEFVLVMNRAAEEASAEVADVFIDAVREMSVADARQILNGPDDAATRYFETKTRTQLAVRFSPIVDTAMQQTGLTALFDFVISRYNQIPLVEDIQFDIDIYVVNKALDGLFVLVSQEETAIREDPAARVTELLRRVFGGNR